MTRLLTTTALLLTAAAGTASAHATLEQQEAAPGETTKITLRVPHGCDGEATNALRIEIPDGFYAVNPMPKAGWTLETETGAYDAPYDNHGREMTEGVRAVSWSGGDLPDAYYDEFTLRGTVGPDRRAGEVLAFPAVQTCATGTAAWTGDHAPSLTLVDAKAASGHDHGAMASGAVTLGDLTIEALFARATLPNQPVAGGFLTLTNAGPEDDRLVSATSEAAGRMEIHEMAMEGDVMRMREVAGGLPIPAGETVTLKPGGYHVMFMDLAGPLTEGDTVEVTLGFERSGEVTLTMPVVARDGTGDHGGMAH